MHLLVLNAKQNTKAIKISVFGFIFNFFEPIILFTEVLLEC